MELRQLQHILAIQKHGQFHRAAEALNLSQPALSKSVRKLEDFFGASLCDRNRQGVTMTPLGEMICRHARMIFAEINYARDAAVSVRTGEEGEVTVGVVLSLSGHLLPTAISNLTAIAPGIKLRVLGGLNDYLFHALRNGDVDLVLSAIPDPPHVENELVHEVLFSDSVSIVARAHHPLAQKKDLKIQETLDFPWILYGAGVLARQHLTSILLSARLSPPDPAIESNDANFIKSIVMKSNFLTYVPFELVRSELQAGDLVSLRIPSSVWQRQVGLTFRQRGSRSPAALRLADAIRQVSKTLV